MSSANTYNISPKWGTDVLETVYGVLPPGDNSDLGMSVWEGMADILDRSVTAGKFSTEEIISTGNQCIWWRCPSPEW
jgi:hypothetical protein